MCCCCSINPAFDVYRVTEAWPIPWSVLGFPRSTQEFIYFNRYAFSYHASLELSSYCSFLSQNGRKYIISSATGLGLPTYSHYRPQVQDAIHAPHITWTDCSDGSVYINATTGRSGRDQSIPSTLSVLPNVIEKSERTVILHGLADFILLAEGTRIAIQYVLICSVLLVK